MKNRNIARIYDILFHTYGPQGWWPLTGYKGTNPTKTGSLNGYHPADYSFPKTDLQRFEICIGAILTQNTNWINAEQALINLKRRKLLSPKAIIHCTEQELATHIRPAGYFNQKARKLKIFAQFYMQSKGSIPSREELLGVWGIGPETADSILLYGYNVPIFVIDAYTKRICINLKFIKEDASYEEVQKLFEKNITKDYRIYQEYHALLVEHAKRYYKKKDMYGLCPLLGQV